MKPGRIVKTADKPLGIRVGVVFTLSDILAIARRKGVFTVTWHYRNDKTYKKCKELVKNGKLRRGYQGCGVSEFHPVEVPPTKANKEKPI